MGVAGLGWEGMVVGVGVLEIPSPNNCFKTGVCSQILEVKKPPFYHGDNHPYPSTQTPESSNWKISVLLGHAREKSSINSTHSMDV